MMVQHGIHVMGNGYNMGYRKKFYLEKEVFPGIRRSLSGMIRKW